MLFLLLGIVVFTAFFFYKTGARYLVHPVFIVLTMYMMTITVAIGNYSYWGDISVNTFLVIIFGLFSFVLGHALSTKVVPVKKVYFQDQSIASAIPRRITVIVSLFMLFVTILDYRDLVILAGGNITKILQVVSAARRNLYINNASIEHTFLVQQGIYACRMLGYIYIFEVLYNKIIRKNRFQLLSVVPVFLSLLQAILSTGRTEILYFMYAMLVMFYCLSMSDNNWRIKNDFKYGKVMIIGVISFALVFIVLANNRSGGGFNVLRSVSVYSGSSVMALDKYISENGISSVATYFGEETQPLLYSITNALKLTSHSATAVMPPVYLGDDMTNIYTALRRYIHDFGFIGMCFIMFFLGYLYSFLFKRIIKRNGRSLSLIVYAFISYPIIEMSIEERFFSNLLTARTVYCLFYLWFFYRIIYRNGKNNIDMQD